MVTSKNYASSTCGSRIVFASPGSQKASSVLDGGGKDSYMLQSCSDGRNYLVIELCDSIIIDKIEITNTESFSGNFKSISIFASNTLIELNSLEWSFVSKIKGVDIHQKQSFPIAHFQRPVFYKYIKLLFIDYYPTDHYYCTISSIKVYGNDIVSDFFLNPLQSLPETETEGEVECFTSQNYNISLQSAFTSQAHLPSPKDVNIRRRQRRRQKDDDSTNLSIVNPLRSLNNRLFSIEYLLTRRKYIQRQFFDSHLQTEDLDPFQYSNSKVTHLQTSQPSLPFLTVDEDILRRLKLLEDRKYSISPLFLYLFSAQLIAVFSVFALLFFKKNSTKTKETPKKSKQPYFRFSKSPTLLLDESRADIMTPCASLNDVIFSSNDELGNQEMIVDELVEVDEEDKEEDFCSFVTSNNPFAPLSRRRSSELLSESKSRKQRKKKNKIRGKK